MTTKPKTFVGSSSEGLLIAKAIQGLLSDTTDVIVWDEDVFLPGHLFLERLERVLDQVDYAILVASPDDLLVKRSVESFSMRDNVLLELGLFMAKLGRKRTYLITPVEHAIHIPTDLLGVKTVSYKLPTCGASWDVEPTLIDACRSIRLAMSEAQSELSNAMRRLMIKRLLVWTTKIHEFLSFAQTESLKSLLDRQAFEAMREDAAQRLETLLSENRGDADLLGLSLIYADVSDIIVKAIRDLPFPEEAIVSSEDVVGGLLSHLAGQASIQDQLRTKIDALLSRYDAWWNQYRARVGRMVGEFQGELIKQL